MTQSTVTHSTLKALILASRPKTLSASVVPIIATVGLVQTLSVPIQWWIVVCALLSSFCIQIGTNFVNDAMDFKKGADTAERLGPARITHQGYMTGRQVMMIATLFFVIAILFGIPLVMHGGWPIVMIGLVSVAMGYAYTSGPVPLAYYGLGDLFVILFFGLVAVGGLFYLLTGVYTTDAFILGLQIGFLSTILIAINNLRDRGTDIKAHKRTLAVIMGQSAAKLWIYFLVVSPFLVGYYWLLTQRFWLYILPVLSLPLGLSLIKKIICTEPSQEYNKFLALGAAYTVIFAVGVYLGSLVK